MFHSGNKGIGSRLPKTANRGVAHGLGKLVEKLTVPLIPLEQGNRLVATHTTWRALAAGLILEESQQVDAPLRQCRPLSEKTTMAWLPTNEPYLSRVPKSSGRSARLAGKIPPEAPPGR